MIPLVAATLVHSSYQGLVVALAAALVADRLKQAPALVRLRVYGVAMLAFAIAPILTFVALSASPPGLPSGSVAAPGWTTAMVVAWVGGVVLSAVRAGHEAGRVEWLRFRSIPAPPALTARFEALARELGVRGHVALRLVADRHSPMAVGVVRRLVLFPAGLLARLPQDQIEALFAHELVHVRRLDPLLAVVQLAVETVLFHHPATWWLSARIREERELVCDEEVAGRCGVWPYAHALTAVAAWRVPALAAGAASGSLLDRIERLFGVGETRRRPRWIAPAIAAAVAFGLASGSGAVAEPVPDGLVPLASASGGGWSFPEATPAVFWPRPTAVTTAAIEPPPVLFLETTPEPVPDLAVVAPPPVAADTPCVSFEQGVLGLRWCGTAADLAVVRAWEPRFARLADRASLQVAAYNHRLRQWSDRGYDVVPPAPFAFDPPARKNTRIEAQLRAFERAVGSWLDDLETAAPALADADMQVDCPARPPVAAGFVAMQSGCGWQLVPVRGTQPVGHARPSVVKAAVQRQPPVPVGAMKPAPRRLIATK